MTQIDVVLTGDVCDFLRRPILDQNGLLLHEQHHAKKQQEMGLPDYQRHYSFDLGWRIEEERAGWGLQIDHVIRNGGIESPYVIAEVFAKVYGGSYDSALTWASERIAAARRAP